MLIKKRKVQDKCGEKKRVRSRSPTQIPAPFFFYLRVGDEHGLWSCPSNPPTHTLNPKKKKIDYPFFNGGKWKDQFFFFSRQIPSCVRFHTLHTPQCCPSTCLSLSLDPTKPISQFLYTSHKFHYIICNHKNFSFFTFQDL